MLRFAFPFHKKFLMFVDRKLLVIANFNATNGRILMTHDMARGKRIREAISRGKFRKVHAWRPNWTCLSPPSHAGRMAAIPRWKAPARSPTCWMSPSTGCCSGEAPWTGIGTAQSPPRNCKWFWRCATGLRQHGPISLGWSNPSLRSTRNAKRNSARIFDLRSTRLG